jgi:excisionase family DNA binding protein
MRNAEVEQRNVRSEIRVDAEGLLTRQGLAHALKVSLSTVDRMVADGDITPMRPHGKLVRFYLPDVVRQLVAIALVSKRGVTRRVSESGMTGGGQ